MVGSGTSGQETRGYFLTSTCFPFQKHAVITIAHLVCKHPAHYIAMKTKKVPALKVRCPTCGAKPGEKCELSTGLPRTEPHRDRRLAALENKSCGPSENTRK